MSLADVIISFNNGPYFTRRYASAAFVNGVAQAPVLLYRVQFDAVLEPATGTQRVVPGFDQHGALDGQFTVDARVLYTQQDLRPRRPTNEPDIVEYDGSDWEVYHTEPWQKLETSFIRAFITRLTRGAS